MTSHRRQHVANLRRCRDEFLVEVIEAFGDGDLLAVFVAAFAGGVFFSYILIFDN